MISYTKLTKQKRFNSSAFTLIELLVVIIIIGIIVATLSFNFLPNKLQLAADQIIKDIRFTQSLALKDDKYQPYPIDTSAKEQNRTKYWFKQWWQIKFSTDGNDIIYYVFSDKPANTVTNNFDKKIITSSHQKELAKYADGRYVYGGDTYLYAHEKPNQDCNLSRYGIKRVELKTATFSKTNNKIRILFDSNGNLFLNEGKQRDAGDVNPFTDRELVTSYIILNLCKKLNTSGNCDISSANCIGLKISPNGNIEKSPCQ